jgi:GNAT superfamily N-acetyltransferase
MDDAGVLAMFDGVDSPLTQTFGLGTVVEPTVRQLDTLERFFLARGAPVHHETSPLADPALVPLLVGRRYQPIEYSSVLYRPIARERERADASKGPIRVVQVEGDDGDRWARTAADGWSSESPALAGFVLDVGRIQGAAVGFHRFLAEADGVPIASGGLFAHDGVALLAGASTVPTGRRLGAQNALLEARLRFAADAGCDLAMMAALPGSGSQRNAERHAFRIAYTRIKWKLQSGDEHGVRPGA